MGEGGENGERERGREEEKEEQEEENGGRERGDRESLPDLRKVRPVPLSPPPISPTREPRVSFYKT